MVRINRSELVAGPAWRATPETFPEFQ